MIRAEFRQPRMILPLAFTIAFIFGGFIYEWPEFSGNYEQYIFFQGSIDMGGACLFAGILSVYLFFGFTAGWYLVLKLEEITEQSFIKIIVNGLMILKYHILAFVVGSTITRGYDALVTPNDFRNMFLFAGLLYSLSFLNICILHKLSINRMLKLILAPTFIFFWIVIGSDGNTARAGQLVSSEKNPTYIIRGKRHAFMMSWHTLCDSAFGDGQITYVHKSELHKNRP